MNRTIVLITIFFASLMCSAQDVEDPQRGVKIYSLVTTINNGKPKHYGSLEELNKIDFTNISSVSIDNRGRKGKMDMVLLDKLINNSPNLISLTLHNVIFDRLPKIEINNNLRQLYLGRNDLEIIPDDIENLKALELFSCSGNKINSLPNKFVNLKSLNTLLLGGNNFTTFPSQMFALKKLTTLGFNEKVDNIPEEIAKLSELKKISLLATNISTLPSKFSKLKNLQVAELAQTKLTDFPSSLLKIQTLKYLSLCGNPINKVTFAQSLKGLSAKDLVIYSSLEEAERLELNKTYPNVDFASEIMQWDIERIVVK